MENKLFTYDDYLNWPDSERWELIYGRAYDMSPAPDTAHQLITMELVFQFKARLNELEKNCKVIAAPFDVRLPLRDEKQEDIENVVQPDISIICDTGKLDEKGCLGAPEMIIEVLSPSSSRRDRIDKFNLYEVVGVKEYWLVSPYERIVEVFVLGEDGKYGRPNIYSDQETAQVQILKDLKIDLSTIFNT